MTETFEETYASYALAVHPERVLSENHVSLHRLAFFSGALALLDLADAGASAPVRFTATIDRPDPGPPLTEPYFKFEDALGRRLTYRERMVLALTYQTGAVVCQDRLYLGELESLREEVTAALAAPGAVSGSFY